MGIKKEKIQIIPTGLRVRREKESEGSNEDFQKEGKVKVRRREGEFNIIGRIADFQRANREGD